MKVIIPIVLAIVLAVIAKFTNPNIETAGILIAAAFGLGIGAVLNSVIFRKKKGSDAKKTE